MTKLCIKNGLVYARGEFVKGTVLTENGKITGITEADVFPTDCTVIDAEGGYVVPGFIDLHTHGADGVDVNAASWEELEKIGCFFATQGTTSWLGSVLTDTREQTLWCIQEHLKYRENSHKGADMMGIHLEGPFLAPAYKGAMPEHLLKTGDARLLAQYQEAAKGNVCYLTVSPEVDGVIEMIPACRELGIVTAIGHSGADYDTAMGAVRAGAQAATHTFNAMKLLHQHFPAIMGAVLESDVYCEAICDGRHLHPAVVRLLLKTKGWDKVVAVTDSIMAAGLPDGDYMLGVNEVTVKDGDACLKSSGVRAGSTLTTHQALLNLMEFTGEPLEKVLPLLTENPARLIGRYDRIGSIAPGKDADIVILNQECEVKTVFVKGSICQEL
ncbi:N-acetylglucosamine-6-phosphate deacetylase [Blautia schinkii]|nr:N-acetylglucosamine-6-phosphate deacetylase [Blautia schinkii]